MIPFDVFTSEDEMMKVIATKTYRPESVSVAGWDSDKLQESAPNYWKWGENLKINAMSMADEIMIRRRLQKGDFQLDVVKRPGRLLVRAF